MRSTLTRGPPLGGGEVRPPAPTLCIAVARVGGSALRGEPLRPLCKWSGPSGTTPSVNSASGRALRGQPLRPLRGQLPFQGSHLRCRLQHTLQKNYASPERGGEPPSGGGEVRPPAPTLCIAVVRVGGSALRGQPLRPLRGQLPFQGSHLRCRL